VARPTITIKIGAASAVDISTLGLTGAVLTTTNQAEDTLELTRPEAIDDTPLCDPWAQVDLFADGVRIFRGWLDEMPERATGRAEARTYYLVGPWRWLERTLYKQDWVCGGTRVAAASGRVRTGLKLGTTNKVETADVAETLAAILDYAVAAAPTDTFTYDLPTIDLDMWAQQFTDISCGQALRAVLRFAPLYACRWVYEGAQPDDPPELKIVRVGATADATLSETVGSARLLDVSATARYDLLCAGVDLYHLYTDAKDYTVLRSKESYNAAVGSDADDLNADRRFEATIRLQSNTDYVETLRDVGMAQELGEYLERLHVQATATLVDETLMLARAPGELWGFGGTALTRYSSYTGVCQQITRDLLGDSVQLKLGPPGQLGFDDLSRIRSSAAGDDAGTETPQDGTEDPGGSSHATSQTPTGWLKVEITPALARAQGAQWHATKSGYDSGWQVSNVEIEVEAGNYTVEFSEIPGWTKPTNASAGVLDGEHESVDGSAAKYTAIIVRQDGTKITGDTANTLLAARSFRWRMLDVSADGVRKDQLYLASEPWTYEE